jgi:hypothetical protein
MMPDFTATMRALTTTNVACFGCIEFAPVNAMPLTGQDFCHQSSLNCKSFQSSRPWHSQFSLFISFDLPTIPSPTTSCPCHCDRFRTLLHRRSLSRLSLGQTSPVEGILPSRDEGSSFTRSLPNMDAAESSSLALRTGLSLQVALHPPSWERSYHCQLQAGNDGLRGTSTLRVKRLHRRTCRRSAPALEYCFGWAACKKLRRTAIGRLGRNLRLRLYQRV